jgi:hypothetical protein
MVIRRIKAASAEAQSYITDRLSRFFPGRAIHHRSESV